MPSDAKSAMAMTRDLVDAHLVEIAGELLDWKATGILVNGRLREAAVPLRGFIPNDALRVAENFATDAALLIIAQRTPAPATREERNDG